MQQDPDFANPCFFYNLLTIQTKTDYLSPNQGTKKIIFTACHLGKLKPAFTSQDVISTSPKNVLTSRIDFMVLLLFDPQKASLAQ